MGTLQLHNEDILGFTTISNRFLDVYMPSANGSFVKVYLYLLRLIQSSQTGLSVSQISDALSCTDGDVIRALKYWDKEGVLSLRMNSSGEVTDIFLLDLDSSPSTKKTESTPHKNYSASEMNTLQRDSDFNAITKVVEGYLERPLSAQDMNLIVFLYKDLQFSDELIYHLFEYCINRGKRRTNYIEKVAISWAEKNVKTPDDAIAVCAEYNADYSAVSKAFGLHRMPGSIEQNFIDRWTREYGFDKDVLVEACNRTLLQIKKPDFSYADRILKNWHDNGVKKFSDIAAQDMKHKSKQQNNTAPQNKPVSKNQFNAFPQRSYSKEDFSSLEKRLLERSLHKN